MTRRTIALPKEDTASAGEPIHVKYRPKKLDDVVGQGAVTSSLKKLMSGDSVPHVFLFSGPGGTGKTTLARILASMLKASPHNITEIDAATNTGVDDMRELTSIMRYQGFGENPIKVFILDECHRLSANAWDSLLKPLEEPPAHVYFMLCTTEPNKLKPTILSRCAHYNLQPVRYDDLVDLLEFVADEEDLDVPGQVIAKVARTSNGSPRWALTRLAKVAGVDERDVDLLLEAPDENEEVIDLCRKLMGRNLKWSEVVTTLKNIPEMSPESIRIVIVNYLAACAMGAKKEGDAARILNLMFPFSKPFQASDKMAPLLLAFGDLILGD